MSITRPIPSKVAKGRLLVNSGKQDSFSIRFQYNPEKVTRSLSLQAVGVDPKRRAEVTAYRGAASETIMLEARFEAIRPTQPKGPRNGVLPQLAELELLLYPTSQAVLAEAKKLDQGTRSIVPFPLPAVILEWGTRAVPVRLTQMAIVEEQFDTSLNPIQATATLTFDVVTYSGAADQSDNAKKFIAYQQKLEQLAADARKMPTAAPAAGS